MPGRVRKRKARRPRQNLSPATLAPYFVVAGLVHAIAIATRFDLIAAQLPDGAPLAIMLAQVPLLYLSGYFEGRLDYGDRLAAMPLWMRIDSKAVRVAFTFGFMYLVVVAAQTWNLRVGPIDPSPPRTFAPEIRAMWFAMFTLGFGMIFFMAAAGIVIPLMRALTFPLRLLPTLAGAVLAVPIGAALGLVVMAAVQSTQIAALFATAKAELQARPALAVGLLLVLTIGPLVLGAALQRRRAE